MAEVTVIIPVYNMEHYIKSSVMSVIDQEGFPVGDIEILVVNDGSTDNTKHIIQELIEGHNGLIKLIDLKDNIGVMGAAIEGLKRASGRYICLLDADDIWHPAKISEVTVFLEKGYDLVLHEGEYIDADGNPINRPVKCRVNDEDIVYYIKTFNGGIPFGSAISFLRSKLDVELIVAAYRKFREEGIERFVSHDTTILHALTVHKNLAAKCIRENLYRYRIHGKNTSQLTEFDNVTSLRKTFTMGMYSTLCAIEIYKISGLYYEDKSIDLGFKKFLYCKNFSLKEKSLFALYHDYLYLLINNAFIGRKEMITRAIYPLFFRLPAKLRGFLRRLA